MSLSRRKFMQAGVVAAACAALPWKSVMAQNRAGSGSVASGAATEAGPPSASVEQLNYYSRTSFAPYVNTEFRVHLDTSDSLGLKLVEVRDRTPMVKSQDGAGGSATTQTECFSLLLTTPPDKSFEQNTYLLEHEALGSFYLFLVPVSAQGKRPQNFYEAVIYRHEGGTKGYNDAAFTPPATSPQKTEQEVFYFRPKAVDPASVERIDPGAAGREAALRLSMSQVSDINGLRLGMTKDQVLSLFPGIEEDKEIRASLTRPVGRFGTSSLAIKPGRYNTRKRFDRVSQISVTFLDGRVSTFNIGYDGPVWGHVDEFVTKFAEEARLPGADSWTASEGMSTQLKTLKCKDFDVSVFAGGENVKLNYVVMRDLTAKQRLQERLPKETKGAG